MGDFEVQVRVSHPSNPGEYHKSIMRVDTGSSHSALPKSVLDRIGILPDGRPARPYGLADDSVRDYETGEARFGLMDEDGRIFARTCPVIFADEGCFLLGATTLQAMGLSVDPENHRLVEAPLSLTSIRGVPVQYRREDG